MWGHVTNKKATTMDRGTGDEDMTTTTMEGNCHELGCVAARGNVWLSDVLTNLNR